jgi:hypothetical protein
MRAHQQSLNFESKLLYVDRNNLPWKNQELCYYHMHVILSMREKGKKNLPFCLQST